MQEIKEKSRHLASLAVFRELYNQQTDIHGVISEFLKGIIISNAKHEFNLTEITELLNTTFDFSIPDAVVSTSLGRIKDLSKVESNYIVDSKLFKKRNDIETLQRKRSECNSVLLESLFTFISEEKKVDLTDEDKDKIINSFCSFLMDDSNGEEFSEYISGFIIKNKQNKEFRKNLSDIREGVILYSGLKYNNRINEVGSWNSELVIFLDTEILFHFAGYNGILFKSIFADFLKYVNEINNKSKNKLIHLKYFKEVRSTVERFFTKAKYIVKGEDKLNPKMTAMGSVIEGCKEVSDVIEKKSDFYLLLKTHSITEEDSTDYYNAENHQYNILSQETINTISSEFEFDITKKLQFLNFISILRKEDNQNNFYNIKYILLSGNTLTSRIAWHSSVKDSGNVPLATNLYWITNKFWFKLNKGFGDGSFPSSLDIITKAQTTLSAVLNESIGEKFDELKEQSEKGNLSKEQITSRIVLLRTQVRKPEDIAQDEISSILNSISENSIEKHIREQEIFKIESKKRHLENKELKLELELKEQSITDEESAKQVAQNDLKEVTFSSKGALLAEKKKTLSLLKEQQSPIDNVILKKYTYYKLTIGSIFLLYYLITFALIYKLSWDIMEQWTYVIGVFPLIVSGLYLLRNEKSLNPIHFLKKKHEFIKQTKYNEFNFNINNLSKLKSEISALEEELDFLKK